MKYRFVTLYVALVFMTSAHAQAVDSRFVLSSWLQQPSLQFGNKTLRTETLGALYQARGYSPLWTDAQGLTPTGQRMVEILDHASEHGLNAQRYDTSILHAVAGMKPDAATDALQIQASVDILLSHTLIQYMADMKGGAVRPQWDAGTARMTPVERRALLQQAINSNDAVKFVADLAPQSPQYRGLQLALMHYRIIEEANGWPEFTVGKTIKPGMQDARIASLRQLLQLTGDFTQATPMPVDMYDPETVLAVQRFQSRHGITADGVIGVSTQQALAVPVAERIAQMQTSLERMRWMPSDLGSRYVMVNVPGYTLTAYAGSDAMTMKVIVGKPESKTPLFSKEITNVVLNPSWGVPAKIAVKEMLPKVRNNPNYLVNAGYTVTQNEGGQSREVDPAAIDWSSVTASNFNYSFRQNPGDDNALGKVKFTIPDSDNIYLHDTANRDLFTKDSRSLSHGCIRLAEPKAMAEFVLRHEGWSEAKVDAAYDSSSSRTVPITPLPVHLVYWTSWVDGRGAVHFGQDIYRMDKSLMLAMNRAPLMQDSISVALNN